MAVACAKNHQTIVYRILRLVNKTTKHCRHTYSLLAVVHETTEPDGPLRLHVRFNDDSKVLRRDSIYVHWNWYLLLCGCLDYRELQWQASAYPFNTQLWWRAQPDQTRSLPQTTLDQVSPKWHWRRWTGRGGGVVNGQASEFRLQPIQSVLNFYCAFSHTQFIAFPTHQTMALETHSRTVMMLWPRARSERAEGEWRRRRRRRRRDEERERKQYAANLTRFIVLGNAFAP